MKFTEEALEQPIIKLFHENGIDTSCSTLRCLPGSKENIYIWNRKVEITMYFNLSEDQENYLQRLPETGMGYKHPY